MDDSLPSNQKVMKHSESLKFKFLELKGALQVVLSSQNSFITSFTWWQTGSRSQMGLLDKLVLGLS